MSHAYFFFFPNKDFFPNKAVSHFPRKTYILNMCKTIGESDSKQYRLSFSFIVKYHIFRMP